ncbi:MAG: ABC transporter ATP-binding protein [Anaerolineae bacterium]
MAASERITLREPLAFFNQFSRALRLAWQTAPLWTLVNAFLVLIQGVLPLAALYLMKRILDALGAALKTPAPLAALQGVLVWILMAGAVALLSALTRLVSDYASEAQSLQVTDYVSDILHAQSIAVDLEYYEDPAYFDTLHRAQQEAPYRPSRIISGLIQIIQNSISLLGILALLLAFNWWLTIVLLVAALPGAVVRFIHSRRLYNLQQAQTAKERRAWFYHGILTEAWYAKELRLFNLGDLFRNRHRDLRQDIRAGRLHLAGQRLASDLVAQLLTVLALFGSLAWIAFQTLHGTITLGDLVIYYLGFQNGLGFMQAVLRALAGLYEDNLFLTNLYRFLDLAPKISTPPTPLAVPQPMPGRIEFKQVGFRYASRTQETLHDINLTLEPGQVIALVGENGSGKTTLVKLLCRLYDPSAGTITVDGRALPELDPVKWRREISVVFQDYVHYALSAAENIWLGNVQAANERPRIIEVSRRSGADQVIERLPHSYDTMLGSWFKEGQELSVGEWQKIALARTFWRDAHILILDEPTSSLDPLAEADLFRHLRELLDGRSAILISHRFSTVQMADYIYVLDSGTVSESGTHQELLARNGQYASLYNAQAQYYQGQQIHE